MLSITKARQLLVPFSVDLSDAQAEQLLTYNALLLRWNKSINLTAIRNPEESVARHFGESLFISNFLKLSGRLLDVGSGAGFPGMAIKLLYPDLSVCLLEPTAKKRAFLKEVARACGFGQVEVIGETLKELTKHAPLESFDFVTIRAVGQLEWLLPDAVRILKPAGNISLWVGIDQVQEIVRFSSAIHWQTPAPIPMSHSRQLLVGVRG